VKSSAKSAVVRSFAKVNLTLDVLGTRADGYHAIESVMQTIGLHDTIALTVSEGGGIGCSCDMPSIPTDERNLACRAASALFESRGIAPGLDICIEKRIPAEAGLGGGSGNAAAVLRGLNHCLGLSLPEDEMCALAAQIGSDVPFFLIGGTALVSG
jgi:4-diphosphocytidyl-2-C-methyl-D-erythritol kinase